jgi:hypothetical protein
MNDSKSLLPISDQYVGSYLYATQLSSRVTYQGVSTVLSYKNCQIGGGAFTGGVTQTATEPTIARLKVAGVVAISASGVSADGADLQFKIIIRQPGDTSFRSVTDTFVPLKSATAVRGTSTITLPLPAGTEIAVDGTTIRTGLDDGVDQIWLAVTFLGLTNVRTNIRFGS